MEHKIHHAPLIGPLPIPHFLGWPEYTPKNTYDIIIPEDMNFNVGDSVVGIGAANTVSKITQRRPAKGDWSKQPIHKNPHFVRFTTK